MPRHNAKRKLRQALLDLLVEHPLDKVDVQDIAAQAEVSRQTFYYNFANKKVLIQWIITDNLEQALTAFRYHRNLRTYLDHLFSSAIECRALYTQLEQHTMADCDYAKMAAQGFWECAGALDNTLSAEELHVVGCMISGCLSYWVRNSQPGNPLLLTDMILHHLEESALKTLLNAE